MKIECTKDDQQRILYICENSTWCPLGKCDGLDDCEGCLFSGIEWVITDNGSDEMDKEKVIKGLEDTAGYFRYLQKTVGFFGDQPIFREHEAHCNNALALLKEQGAKTPVEYEHNGYWSYTCPTCGNHEELFREWNYCPFCGQAVKWE